MNIPITQEEENYTAEIDTRVHAGVVVHKIKFESLSVKVEEEDDYLQKYEDGEAVV